MNPIKHFHQTAMEYAVLADVAEAKGKPDDAKLFYRKAFELENEVVQMMPPDDNEPLSRLVLLRSAAALAYHAGRLEESEELIRTALSQNPPDFMVKELKGVSKLVKKAKTAASEHIRLEKGEANLNWQPDIVIVDVVFEPAFSSVVVAEQITSVLNRAFTRIKFQTSSSQIHDESPSQIKKTTSKVRPSS